MAKNKAKSKKLTLKRETVRALTPTELGQIAGGCGTGTCHTNTVREE
jgi:hypothetical protein